MSRYQQGASVERQVSEKLGALGYDVIRSAGSKGGADLVAFTDDEMCLIQVKKSNGLIAPYERIELLRMAKRAGAYALVAHKITDPQDRRKKIITFRELLGTGPRQWQNWVPQRKEDAMGKAEDNLEEALMHHEHPDPVGEVAQLLAVSEAEQILEDGDE